MSAGEPSFNFDCEETVSISLDADVLQRRPRNQELSAVFYTTEAFNLGQQIHMQQTTDGFLADAGTAGVVEDPIWTGTCTAAGEGAAASPPPSASLGGEKRAMPGGDSFVGG